MIRWVVFVVYTVVYVFIAISFLGGGDGALFFFVPVLTWFFLLTAMVLSHFLEKVINRWLFVTVMFFHYLHILINLVNAYPDSLNREFNLWLDYPFVVLLTFTWYVLGQIYIWGLFVRRNKI